MSETNGNASATYNIPLNIGENDIFRIGRAHLQHFLQVNVNTDDCKPMMLKMHLELEDHPPSIEEAEERNTEHNSSIKGLRQSIQQLQEEIKALKDALLQAKEEAVNPNNGLRESVQQHEEEMKALKDALLQAKEEAVNPNNGLRQSVQQHEEEIKALKDALLQAKEEAVNPNNGLRESVQQHEEEMKALKDALLQAKEEAVNPNNGLRQSVQQHEEEIKALKDALLQAKEEAVNPNNCLRQSVQQHEEEIKALKDALLQAKEEAVNPNNGLRQSVQQHEEEIKALKDALLQAKEEAVNPNNGLRQSVQQHEEEIKALKDALLQIKENDAVNRIDKAPGVDNNAMQESNSNKEANNENKLDGKHNDTENVASASASASEGHHTNIMPEFIDLRRNCVYIQYFKWSDSSLSTAFSNIHKLANEMKTRIPDDSVIHIDVRQLNHRNLDYYVYFCNADIKEEFLKNRHFYAYDPETRPLRIFDYSDYGIVDIQNIPASDWNLKWPYFKVIDIADKMGLTIDSDDIDHIDMFNVNGNDCTYSVQFNTEFIRQEFLRKKDNLKQFPETKPLLIVDAGGHALTHCKLVNISMAVANAKVIGVAKLIGLPLASDNLKRIYVLNYIPYCCADGGFSLIVEFSSMQIKDEFLEKKFQLQDKKLLNDIKISDINARKNIVLIKYKHGDHIQA